MSKQSKSGSGNMLLLAGLGVGAFMLFANKSGAQSRPADTSSDAGGGTDADIPAAPRILAVNSSASESPLPTGIVSDEEGMEVTAPSAPQSRQTNSVNPGPDIDGGESEGDDNAGATSIPPLISTTLTPKEKAIIDRGQLTNDLAIQRPDLYRAIYIRKHGGRGNGQKALQAADALISRIQANATTTATPVQKKRRRVALKLHPQAGSMVRAAQAGAARTATRTSRPGQPVVAGRTVASGRPALRPGSKRKHPQKSTIKHPAGRKRVAVPQKGAVRKRR